MLDFGDQSRTDRVAQFGHGVGPRNRRFHLRPSATESVGHPGISAPVKQERGQQIDLRYPVLRVQTCEAVLEIVGLEVLRNFVCVFVQQCHVPGLHVTRRPGGANQSRLKVR